MQSDFEQRAEDFEKKYQVIYKAEEESRKKRIRRLEEDLADPTLDAKARKYCEEELERMKPLKIQFHYEKFNEERRNSNHTDLILTLQKNLPGAYGIYRPWSVGPSFIAFVYDVVKMSKQDINFATILLTANLLMNDPTYDFSVQPDVLNETYLFRIRNYLDDLQRHIQKNPEYYNDALMTKIR